MNSNNDVQFTSRVNIIEMGSFSEASTKATEEASNSGATAFPVVMFQQGNRTSFSGALPMKRVESFLDLSKSASKGDSIDQIRAATNRPHMPEHSAAISRYIQENLDDYIIPGLTINVQAALNVYTARTTSTVKAAYLVIPDTAPASITDGGHRSRAIAKARDEMSPEQRDKFNQDAVAFMLTCTSDMDKVHQDFADCSKTKQLPPAMLTVYDLRNPANSLVIKLIEDCPVFKDKVDSTSQSIGKNSAALFTTNQVRQLVKTLLTADLALNDVTFAKVAKEMLPTGLLARQTIEQFEEYVNSLTEHLPVWDEASKVPPGLQHARLKQIRSRGYVCLTATGLNIIGTIGHELLVNHKSEWKVYAERLAQLDWRKSNPLWSEILQQKKDKYGNQVMEEVTIDGKTEQRPVMNIITNRGPVTRTIHRAMEAIGLGSVSLPPQTEDPNAVDEPVNVEESVIA